jgi:hypothetical protein
MLRIDDGREISSVNDTKRKVCYTHFVEEKVRDWARPGYFNGADFEFVTDGICWRYFGVRGIIQSRITWINCFGNLDCKLVMGGQGDPPRVFDTAFDRIDVNGSEYRHPSFDPLLVRRRVDVEPGTMNGPDPADIINGTASGARAEMFAFTPSVEFTAGGFQRSKLFQDYSLLPGFKEHLESYDRDVMDGILREQRQGVDVVGDMSPQYVELVRPTDAALSVERRTRDLRGHRSSPRLLLRPCTIITSGECNCFICFAVKTTNTMLRSGAARCLGTVEDVRHAGALPSIISSVTLEVTKPR